MGWTVGRLESKGDNGKWWGESKWVMGELIAGGRGMEGCGDDLEFGGVDVRRSECKKKDC